VLGWEGREGTEIPGPRSLLEPERGLCWTPECSADVTVVAVTLTEGPQLSYMDPPLPGTQ
jgi:hypothetical protein